MKKLSVRILALTVGVGLLVGLAGCCSIVKSCLHQVIIVQQPQDRAALTNANVLLSVVALAGPPFSTNGLSYQWQFNGTLLVLTNSAANWVNLTGATSSSVTITNLTTNNVGFYRVLVSGSSTVTSAPASLQMIQPGTITVYGTPVLSSDGNADVCPGTCASYVYYSNSPPTLWGWAVINPNLAASGTDAGNGRGTNPRVEYMGCYLDGDCHGSSVSIPINSISPRYVFTIYFDNVPTGPYPISLGNNLQ